VIAVAIKEFWAQVIFSNVKIVSGKKSVVQLLHSLSGHDMLRAKLLLPQGDICRAKSKG
jgi:hypothetical protein